MKETRIKQMNCLIIRALNMLFPLCFLEKAWSEYLIADFKPFFDVRINAPEQKQALQNILAYCDETTLHVPFLIKLGDETCQWEWLK